MRARLFILFVLIAACGTSEAAPTARDIAGLRLPPGFRISVFAKVPNARSMALSPAGTLYVGSRSAGRVYAIPGAAQAAAKNEPAQAFRVIAAGLDDPNGVAFADGSLYVAEVSRIVRFDDIEAKIATPPKPVVVRADYPDDQHHGWKYIAIGPDGWLYVPVGAPCNLCLEDNPIFASITRMTLDGKTREIFARGLRNTVGFDWHPDTKALWFTENGSDGMGDEFPGDELNHAPKAGLHYGYPHCHNGEHRDDDFGKDHDCGRAGPYTYPARVLAPHVAALGMKFYRGDMFPPEYKGRVLIAEHGSWNRSKPIGYRVMMVRMAGERAESYEPFIEGWLADGKTTGRPVDLLELPDGSLLVSDDSQGYIYRVTYARP